MNVDSNTIATWEQFRTTTAGQSCRLLERLSHFQDPILVAGCQRSGTTILSELIIESEGISDYRSGTDSELDGAMILIGMTLPPKPGRYCFQTTYLDDHYYEYFSYDHFRLIWMLRNPYSTVYSMVHNWQDWALDHTFFKEAYKLLPMKDRWKVRVTGRSRVERLSQACCVYNWKLAQLHEIVPRLGRDRILVVGYDELVLDKNHLLPRVYEFLELQYDTVYAHKLHAGSVTKRQLLTETEKYTVSRLCEPSFHRALEFSRRERVFLDEGWKI